MQDDEQKYRGPINHADPDKPAHQQEEPGIEFAPGIYADHTLTDKGVAWLEDYYGLPAATLIPQWKQAFGREELNPILVALLLQRNLRMTDREAWRLVRAMKDITLAKRMIELGQFGVNVTGCPKRPRGGQSFDDFIKGRMNGH